MEYPKILKVHAKINPNIFAYVIFEKCSATVGIRNGYLIRVFDCIDV